MEKYKRYLDQDVDFDNIDSDDECAIESIIFLLASLQRQEADRGERGAERGSLRELRSGRSEGVRRSRDGALPNLQGLLQVSFVWKIRVPTAAHLE